MLGYVHCADSTLHMMDGALYPVFLSSWVALLRTLRLIDLGFAFRQAPRDRMQTVVVRVVALRPGGGIVGSVLGFSLTTTFAWLGFGFVTFAFARLAFRA